MFEEHLLRNFTGQAEIEIQRNKTISKFRYIACPVEYPIGYASRIPLGKNNISVLATCMTMVTEPGSHRL